MIIRVMLFVSFLIIGFFYFIQVTSLPQTGNSIVDLQSALNVEEKRNRDLTFMLGDRLLLQTIENQVQQEGLIIDIRFAYIPKPPSSLVMSKK